MGQPKAKYYVVWEGNKPGVYSTWADCKSAVNGYSGAKYKSFPTLESARKAFRDGPDDYWGTARFVSPLSESQLEAIGQPIPDSICVDAACNIETRVMEYRGVWLRDRSIAFQRGPFKGGTNNLGEFLAIVHALALLSKQSLDLPVYSDSHTAIVWVTTKNVQSKAMETGQTSRRVNDLVQRALEWLSTHQYTNQILKWETEAWGEIPADYGRK